MAQASAKMVEVGIVLQGGGALGAYECGALNALLELMDELGHDIARRRLLPVFEGCGLVSTKEIRRSAAPARS